jgi:CelD/BcsL family acetyltransferase involved in cellulose biosynthesis
MEKLEELNRARWGSEGHSFQSPAYLRFHELLSRRMLDAGALLLVLLAVDETIVAASYDFLWAGKIWGFQGGWLPDYEQFSVGTIVTGKAMEQGIQGGYREYDFLKGDRAYKRRWATEQRVLVDLQAYARTPKAFFWRSEQRAEDRLRRLLRRGARE